jgi:hypothetical protein
MKSRFLSIVIFLFHMVFVFSCKTSSPSKAIAADNKQQTLSNSSNQTAYPTEPGTCVIQAYIISIIPINNVDLDEPCKSFPCKANIIITKCNACGFGVQRKPIVGDTLEVNFTHSIMPSQQIKDVYPTQVNLPGLKQDQLFDAQMRIKFLPSEKLAYEIGNYDLVH